jgi:prepilin-type processing-associated H-X9-DG protein/prepilin-type N-terminal cleavage/methylation domain-containing protein
MRRTPAFTLVELLVVIGIIAVLIAVLLPVLRKARESGNAVACMSNLRQISMAGVMFSNAHKGYLIKPWYNDRPLNSGSERWEYRNPQYGWTYILNLSIKNKEVFECPSVRPTQLRGLWTVAGTAGLSDTPEADDIPSAYRMNWSNFAGLDSIKVSRLKDSSRSILFVEGSPRDPVSQPTVTDEPWGHVATWDSVRQGNVDVMVRRNVRHKEHKGRANYGFVDGHVEALTWEETWKPIGPREPIGGLRLRSMWRQLYIASASQPLFQDVSIP